MLQFCRTKFVGFEPESDEILKIFGTLDDTLYSMQVDMKIKLPELIITSVTGKMRRFTTPFCEESLNFLKKAEGLKIEPGFQSQIKKLVARPGCRHFGNLINECCDSILPALVCTKYKNLREDDPDITIDKAFKHLITDYPQIKTYCMTFQAISKELE